MNSSQVAGFGYFVRSDFGQAEVIPDQTEIEKQLKHAQQQLDLTNAYPGRRVAVR